MSKKDLMFIFGLSLLMGVIWVVGEVVMGLWIPVSIGGHIAFFVAVVALTLIISVWHSLKNDESDLKDPKRAKYERKTKKK